MVCTEVTEEIQELPGCSVTSGDLPHDPGAQLPLAENDTVRWARGFSNPFWPWHPFFQQLLIRKPTAHVSWHGEQEWRIQGPHKFNPDLTVPDGLPGAQSENRWRRSCKNILRLCRPSSSALTPHNQDNCCLPTAASKEFKTLFWIWKWSLSGWIYRPQPREFCCARHSNFPSKIHQLGTG